MVRKNYKLKLVFYAVYTTGAILLFSSLYFFAKDFFKVRKIDSEITTLKTHIEDTTQHNARLQELIQYFNSTGYAEKKAREDLGLKKEGESVVIIKREGDTNVLGVSYIDKNFDSSNAKKWWNYFFKTEMKSS